MKEVSRKSAARNSVGYMKCPLTPQRLLKVALHHFANAKGFNDNRSIHHHNHILQSGTCEVSSKTSNVGILYQSHYELTRKLPLLTDIEVRQALRKCRTTYMYRDAVNLGRR